MAAVGGTSHASSVGRIGLELQARGHSFALLVSSKDILSRTRLDKGAFKEVRQIQFDGPPTVGAEDWLQAQERDPQKVYIKIDVAGSHRAFLGNHKLS